MRKGHRWTGELARPIRIRVNRPHGFILPDAARDPEADSKVRAENKLMVRLRDERRAEIESAKLKLLAEHYCVPPDDFRSLAIALARDLIPGFRFIEPLRPLTSYGPQYEEKVKGGRPTRWNPDQLEELLTEVKAIKKTNAGTDRDALAVLARKIKWRAPSNHRGSSAQWLETLESRLQDARRQQKM